jgi:N6-L-threonylcarbamoyladenine synthase
MTQKPGLDFSFSGLKTCALNAWQKHRDDFGAKADIALAFEEAVVETLLIKCRRALEQTGLPRLVISGGVSANKRLREALATFASELGVEVFYPRLEYCTDNAVMIAYAGAKRLARGEAAGLAIRVRPRWPMFQHGDWP